MKINRLLLLSIVLGGMTMYLSCRKADTRTENIVIDNSDAIFFDSHQSTNPIVQAMTRFMKVANTKHNFTGHIVKEMGIPYWDKSILYYLPQSVLGRNASDTSYVAYIPLVQNGQNYVDGQLTVKVTPTDTTYSFLSDRQYDEFGFQPNADSLLNGLKIFCLFARHEKNVFGHTMFTILDNRIFNGQTTFNIDTTKSYMVELDTLNSSARLSVMAGPPSLPNSSCILVNEMIASGYNVTYSQVGGVCVISSYSLGGEPSGGPGGGGGGGTGGWTPGGGSNSSPPQNEPIDSILAKTSRAINDSASYVWIQSGQNNNEEWGFIIVKKNDSIYTKNVRTDHNVNEVKQNKNDRLPAEILIGEFHVHQDPNPLDRSAPSGADANKLKFESRLNYIVYVELGDKRYALVIEDVQKSRDFLYSQPYNNYLYQQHYLQTLAEPDYYTNFRAASERVLLRLIGSSSTNGIAIYRSTNSEKTQYEKLN